MLPIVILFAAASIWTGSAVAQYSDGFISDEPSPRPSPPRSARSQTPPLMLTPMPGSGPSTSLNSLLDCDRAAASPWDKSLPAEIRGIEIEQIDPSRAEFFCRLAIAVNRNEPRYEYNLGRALDAAKKYQEAFQHYRRAADLGHPQAMNNLGVMLENGRGVSKDLRLAVEWYRKSAALGDIAALRNIGLAYEWGRGVPMDGAEALRWYHTAIERGHHDAMLFVGRIHRAGNGVPKNETVARAWFEKAGALGNVKARELLDSPTEKDTILALRAIFEDQGDCEEPRLGRDPITNLATASHYNNHRFFANSDSITFTHDWWLSAGERGRSDDAITFNPGNISGMSLVDSERMYNAQTFKLKLFCRDGAGCIFAVYDRVRTNQATITFCTADLRGRALRAITNLKQFYAPNKPLPF
jgi:hypothetical protein